MSIDWQQLELAPELIHALLEQQLNKPMRIQQEVIPLALAGHDVLANSPTGTGKTLAYLLPALQYLFDFPRRKPGFARVLVLVPTRELAEQVGGLANTLAQAVQLKTLTITGGVNFGSHLAALEKNIDLIVATPGRLIDYLAAEQFSAEDLELLILDEGDRLLDMGFRDAVKQVQSEAPLLKQRLLFSATADHHALRAFSKNALSEPINVQIEPPKRERAKITQWIHLIDDQAHKNKVLIHLLKETTGRVLIFVRKREKVHALNAMLQAEGFSTLTLEGNLPQNERQLRLKAFHDLRSRILIATDLAARGLDVADIERVINYDLPQRGDTYVHRIGRTGRAGKKGIAVSLVEAHDASQLGRIERYLDVRLERRVIETLRPQFKFPDPHKSRKKKKKKHQK